MAASIHIEGSSRRSRADFLAALPAKPFHTIEAALVMTCRSTRSLLREWAAHKLLYQLHILRSHTESVDLDYPQRLSVRIAYRIVGGIALIFYR